MAASVYNQVTMNDSVHLTDEDGIFSVKAYDFYKTSRFKSFCSFVRRNKMVVLMVSTGCIVLVALAIIAATAMRTSERHPTGNEGRWENTLQGLVFYPVPEDKSIVISFAPSDFSGTARHPIVKSLDDVMKDYNSLTQFNDEQFADCNMTYAPYNKICRVPRSMFKDECMSQRHYGYSGGQPCIFIQLNLLNNVVIKAIGPESALWNQMQAQAELKNVPSDPSYIPVTCRGTAEVDTKILESKIGYGPHGERVMYYPHQGLLSYLYRERNTSLKFLKPGIMIQFTSLVSRHMVHITCTAWGQLYRTDATMIDHQLYRTNATMIDHQLLTIQFALFADHT